MWVGASGSGSARKHRPWSAARTMAMLAGRAERLRQRFTQVTYKVYEGAAHGFFSFGAGSAEVLADLLRFLDEDFAPPAA